MHIAFDGCDQELSTSCIELDSRGSLFFVHEGLKVGDRLFHHAGAFDNLRQKHFPLSKQVTNNAHTSHQWAFNDVQALVVVLPCLFSVLDNVFIDSFDEGMFHTSFDGLFTPGQVFARLFLASSFYGFSEVQHPIGSVVAAIPKDVFDTFKQIFRDLFIDF